MNSSSQNEPALVAPRSKRAILLGLFLVLDACITVSCATFRGPGPLDLGKGGGGVDPKETSISEPDLAGSPSSLALNGTRGFSATMSDIKFDWPVDEARMTRAFFASPGKRKRSHWGLDLANHRGTPILAAQKGTVIYTGRAFHGYGRLVVIEHNDEWATMYAHLDKILVSEGQKIEKGERLGLMGKSGNARGVHLHFEVRRFRQPVNPLAYLPDGNWTRSVAGEQRASSLRLTSQEAQPSNQTKQ